MKPLKPPEIVEALRQGGASAVEHKGTIVGDTTDIAYLGHSVAPSDHGLAALIAAAPELGGPGVLPVGNGEIFRWRSRGASASSRL